MGAQDRLTICLIGPTSGGKTSLLATLTDCVAAGAHGYPPDCRFVLYEIPETEFTSEGVVPSFRILDARNGDYERLRRRFGSPALMATETQDTYAYFFCLESRLPRAPTASSSRILLRVIDAAGEIAVAQDGAEKAPDPEVVQKFGEQISEAEALIFSVPLVNLTHASWINSLNSLMGKIANYGSKKLKRVVVAFTQYERLFVQLGPMAFRYALDPQVVLHILRRCLETAPWLEQLRPLETQTPPVAIRFAVTSAFGFVRKYDNPNIDPHQDVPALFRAGTGQGRHATLWRPFLTAEPFLWAALGEDTRFMFSFAQLLDEPPSESEALPDAAARSTPRLARSRPDKTWIQRVSRTVVDAFDVNRR